MTDKTEDKNAKEGAETEKNQKPESKDAAKDNKDAKDPKDNGASTTQNDEDLENSDDWVSKLNIEDNQKKYIKKTITQAKNRKEKISELETKLAEIEKKEADEQRKRDEEQGNWKKIAEDTDAKLKEKDLKLIRAEVRAAAVKEGIVDPSIIDLLPLEGVSISADGNLVGVDKFVSKYKKEKAYLFEESKKKEPEGTTTDKPTPPPNTSAMQKDALKMTDEEFAKAEAELVKKKR